jgi:hypothetical protein
MAYQIPVKYFNSFWLKKVVGDDNYDVQTELANEGLPWNYESNVTTSVEGGGIGEGTNPSPAPYVIPTWPGLPWGNLLQTENPDDPNEYKSYPAFPWGGQDWASWSNGLPPGPTPGGSLLNSTPSKEDGQERNWAIEEARIRGGFNNTIVDLGVKAYLVEDIDTAQHRFNTLIYSGIYNSVTGVNDTNVFSTATKIDKNVDPAYGSIQKLYAYNTNLTVFQENKVSYILIDKDALYTGDGGQQVTSTPLVLGQVVPYAGEFGISTYPESWAQYGFRQYFADPNRGAILRLSADGITEISNYGMTDYFRDSLEVISNEVFPYTIVLNVFNDGVSCINGNCIVNSLEVVINSGRGCDCDQIELGSLLSINGLTIPSVYVSKVSTTSSGDCLVVFSRPFKPNMYGLTDYPTQVSLVSYAKDTIKGGFDTWTKQYVLSIQNLEPSACGVINRDTTVQQELWSGETFSTLSFDESINGWVSFYSYRPTIMGSVQNNFFSIKDKDIYKHYVDTSNNYETFYNKRTPASIEFILNSQPSAMKNFQTMSYEGSSGWEALYFVSDLTEQLYNPFSGQYIAGRDITNPVLSLQEGEYVDPNSGYTNYAGFYLKENQYVTNLINNSSPIPNEILSGQDMSGIKGHTATVRLSTDNITDVGGMKELFTFGSKYVISSI